MSDNDVIIGLGTILVLGIGAQWIGRRLDFPSLLLLLPAGLLAGDVLGLVQPQELFGDTLFPLITLLVALLLFQSGLQLRLADLHKDARVPVFRLVSIGGAVTFVGSSLAVLAIFDVGANLAFLVGAIVVVSGPTVVGPMLDVVRPRRPTGPILNWEGTVLDPVGATLGVVVLNVVLASGRGGVHPLLQMSARLALGVAVGFVAAGLMVFVMSRFLVTDNMEAAVALLFAVAAFAVADVLLSEAGLFATVTMGMVAANQRVVPTARIKGFGETLEVLIIAILFILLGALVEIDALASYAWQTTILVAVLVVLVRPVSTVLSLWNSKLPGRDRALIAGMDPRGIVAASTAAQFSVTLSAAGFDSGFILPTVFGVILGTGLVYGLGAAPLAKRLGVAQPAPNGVGIVGDASWLADFARALHGCGVPVLLVTSDPPRPGDTSEVAVPRISLSDSESRIADALAEAKVAQVLVSNDPGPALTVATAVFIEHLGRRHVLRVPDPDAAGMDEALARMASRHPFAPGLTRSHIDDRVAAGATVRVVAPDQAGDVLALAAVAADGTVDLTVSDHEPASDATVIGLVGGHVSAGTR